jgi:hypothetical protein
VKKPSEKTTEQKCPARNGIGFPVGLMQSVQPDRKFYPPTKRCAGARHAAELPQRVLQDSSPYTRYIGKDVQGAAELLYEHAKRQPLRQLDQGWQAALMRAAGSGTMEA